MAIRSIVKLNVTCDNCKKIIATGRTSANLLAQIEQESKYTEIFCVDCVKLPPETLKDTPLSPL